MTNIALFASGTGSNALNIISYFKHSNTIHVALVVSNKADAAVLQKAKDNNIPTLVVDRTFYNSSLFVDLLKEKKIDFIVLAGFLWLIPANLVKAYQNKMINIHPALLPAYGGKGMYGERVHKAVIASKVPESGITIHYVNEHFDEGEIIFQAKCVVTEDDTSETLAQKIHQLEHQHFPRIIEQILLSAGN